MGPHMESREYSNLKEYEHESVIDPILKDSRKSFCTVENVCHGEKTKSKEGEDQSNAIIMVAPKDIQQTRKESSQVLLIEDNDTSLSCNTVPNILEELPEKKKVVLSTKKEVLILPALRLIIVC